MSGCAPSANMAPPLPRAGIPSTATGKDDVNCYHTTLKNRTKERHSLLAQHLLNCQCPCSRRCFAHNTNYHTSRRCIRLVVWQFALVSDPYTAANELQLSVNCDRAAAWCDPSSTIACCLACAVFHRRQADYALVRVCLCVSRTVLTAVGVIRIHESVSGIPLSAWRHAF